MGLHRLNNVSPTAFKSDVSDRVGLRNALQCKSFDWWVVVLSSACAPACASACASACACLSVRLCVCVCVCVCIAWHCTFCFALSCFQLAFPTTLFPSLPPSLTSLSLFPPLSLPSSALQVLEPGFSRSLCPQEGKHYPHGHLVVSGKQGAGGS